MSLAAATPILREKIARTFSETATIYRRAGTGDTEGNVNGAGTSSGTVAGRWGVPAARELEVAAQQGQEIDGVFTVAYDATLKVGDVLDIGGFGRWRVTFFRPGRVQAKAGLARVDG